MDNDASIWDINGDDFTEDIPEYNEDEWDGDDFWEILLYFKYLLNVFFIVIPMAFCEFLFICYNLYFNAIWNRWWANGNVYLMVNTVYLFY